MRTVTQELLAEYMSPVIWHGRYFTTLCPFHDDTFPSFNVYPDGAVCLAASCKRSASLTSVYAKVSHSAPTFTLQPHASLVRWESIPDHERLCSEAHEYLLKNPNQGHYLKQRGLDGCIRRQELGYWNGWITVPVFDAGHHFQGMVLRATPSMQAATDVRYLAPPGQARMLYVPDHSLTLHSDHIFIVFGIFDALALSLLGIPTLTSTNVRGFRSSDLDYLRCKLTVIPDKGEDDKGRDLMRGLDWRGQLLLLPYPANLKDPAGYVEAGYSKPLIKLLRSA